jgi:para-aminobenzoate synthetase
MRILLIDNYDSFTYNLFQQIATVVGVEPEVYYNNEISYQRIVNGKYDCVIISPGPGRPDIPRDFGVCKEVIEKFNKPLLGVCLGHQGLGLYAGCKVVHAPEPYHGRSSAVYHNNLGVFEGIPQGFNVVRYHSLMIAEPLTKDLIKTAWTEDGLIMGVEHASKPYWGVQYHPESICTEYGDKIISNFFSLSEKFYSTYYKSSVAI